MTSFQEMNLEQSFKDNLAQINFSLPTPIQAAAIPLALEGKDILGSAQTGTGKTAAFGIPLIAKLMSKEKKRALVMTPTRELATQVAKQFQLMIGKSSNIKTAVLIGGEPMFKQLNQLKRNPEIIVGTPGRINDHLNRKSLDLSETDFLVLDETDRMLDMGFSIQIEDVVGRMPETRQTMLFSATLPGNIVKISRRYLNDPEQISVNPTSSPAENIEQENINVSEGEKYTVLKEQLESREGSVIIFVKTKHGADKLAKRLNDHDFTASAIHGDLRQSKRDRVIANFRQEKYRILVATDVAARGLDIPHIQHVVNYDLPQCPEDYIHRIGRTARAGSSGFALNIVCPVDKSKWNAIDRLMNPDKYKGKPSFDSESRGRGGPRNRSSNSRNSFGGNRPRRDDGQSRSSFGDRPRRDGGQSKGSFGDRPRRDDGQSRGSFGDRPRRDNGQSKGSFGDRPRRDGGQSRGSYSSDRPRRDDGQSRGSYSSDRPRRSEASDVSGNSFSYKSPYEKGSQSRGRPQRRDEKNEYSTRRSSSTSDFSNKPSSSKPSTFFKGERKFDKKRTD